MFFAALPNKIWTTLLAYLMLITVAQAQTVETPPVPTVGDKWTFRFHNKGDKREPHLFTNEVKAVDSQSAWLYGESQEVNARRPKFVLRWDLKRAASVEWFAYDGAAVNGVGRRTGERLKNDDLFQFPLFVGKKYAIKLEYPEFTNTHKFEVEVEAFEKIKVEAGEFDAYRIKYKGWWTNYGSPSGNGRVEMSEWWAPAAQRSIKSEYIDYSQQGGGQWNHRTTELVKWEPKATLNPALTAMPAPAASGPQ